MEILKTIKKIENSPGFKEWREKNKDAYLVHIFRMLDEPNENIWQIGYYDAETDKITTFVSEKDSIRIIPEQEVFKEKKHQIKELDIEKVKIDFDDALNAAQELRKNEYPRETPLKTIVLLQNTKLGDVWNITFFTNSFKALNVKISSEDCKILEHELSSLMQFQ